MNGGIENVALTGAELTEFKNPLKNILSDENEAHVPATVPVARVTYDELKTDGIPDAESAFKVHQPSSQITSADFVGVGRVAGDRAVKCMIEYSREKYLGKIPNTVALATTVSATELGISGTGPSGIENKKVEKFTAACPIDSEKCQNSNLNLDLALQNRKTKYQNERLLHSKNNEQTRCNENVPATSAEKLVNCRECDEKFTEPSLLDKHYKFVHNLDCPYQCWRCSYRTSFYGCMDRHMDFCGSLTPYPCNECQGAFADAETLSDHRIDKHSSLKPIDVELRLSVKDLMEFEHSENFGERLPVESPELLHCSECGDLFKNAHYLMEHKESAHSRDLSAHGLESAPNVSSEIELLTRVNEPSSGELDQTKEPKVEDKSCFGVKNFGMPRLKLKKGRIRKVKSEPKEDTIAEKRRSVKVVADDTLYLCPHSEQGCKYKSTNKSNFAKHMGTHVDRYTCDSCGYKCRRKKQLKQHYQSVHGSCLKRTFLCSICGKNFKCNGRLKVHLRVHMNDRPFICDQCGKGFASKCMLTDHQKVKHTDEVFTCQTCGKEFPAKKYLQKHVKTHDTTRIFLCDACPKAFKTAAHLRAHTRVHTGEKPFECAECGKRFKQICGLIAHKNAHLGKKSYICSACETGFIYNSSLKNGLCLQCRKGGITVDTNTVIAKEGLDESGLPINFVKIENETVISLNQRDYTSNGSTSSVRILKADSLE